MLNRTLRSVWYTCVCLICLNALQQPTQAGQPLICHPFEIGNARSLPWSNTADKFAGKSDYDLQHLVNNTLALLTPNTPVIVRMETLRRATIYSVWMPANRGAEQKALGRKIADELLAQLLARAQAISSKDKAATLAWFDAGYLLSTYRQSGWHLNQHTELDAYALVRKAAAQSGDATMEYAAALCTYDKSLQRAHLQKAVASAPEGSLLARNLVSHFSTWGRDLASLRTNLAVQQ
jgi:hypothetical protein